MIVVRTITIPWGVLPRGEYARNVIRTGHRPGVLSGCNLKGKAARYCSRYKRQRDIAARVLAPFGVEPGKVLINSRWCVVWTVRHEPVRVVVEGEA